MGLDMITEFNNFDNSELIFDIDWIGPFFCFFLEHETLNF